MEKAQEQLYRMMENRYFYAVDKVLCRQDSLFKTYLWSASLSLALNFSLLKDHPFFWPLPFWKYVSLSSLALAFFVLAYCLDSLRGKSDQRIEFPNYRVYLDYLGKHGVDTTMKMVADDFEEHFTLQAEEQTKRAKRLRASSKFLVLSFAALAVAGVAYILA